MHPLQPLNAHAFLIECEEHRKACLKVLGACRVALLVIERMVCQHVVCALVSGCSIEITIIS